jgi:hypothetical protein
VATVTGGGGARAWRGGPLPTPSPGGLAVQRSPLEDRTLVELARRTDLTAPRHWVHRLSLPDEPAARAARLFFETVAARHGGDYDGWEARA